jgi:hypothetical protein
MRFRLTTIRVSTRPATVTSAMKKRAGQTVDALERVTTPSNSSGPLV